MSYKPFQDRAVKTNRRTDLSFSVVLDRTDLSLDGLVCSLNAAVGITVSDWAFFVHDFCWNVRGSFVFDVDDARFMVALQYHFLMTCGQHVVRECSFCVTMTRAFARSDVSKERFHQSVITSWNGDWRSILTHEHTVCGELRHAARTRLVVWAFFTFGTYAVSTPVSENGKCVNLCCSTAASLGITSTSSVQVLRVALQRHPQCLARSPSTL